MSVTDDPISSFLLLLRRAGLQRFEDILEQAASLEKRLDIARRDLHLFSGSSVRELASLFLAIAEGVRTGEITRAMLSRPEVVNLLRRSGWWLPGDADLSVRGGMAGKEDFDPWAQPDKKSADPGSDDEAALPGREDFDPWSDGEDEDR
jgi:hypothetical protein